MLDLVSTLVWAGALVAMSHRLALAWERTAGRAQVAQPKAQPVAEVPEDLVALAMSEREAWAQEEVLRVVRERYVDLGDWNLVRTAMGIGRIG